MPDAYVLMYHRICAVGPTTTCYFERGTAVRPENFHTQLEHVAQRFELLTPTQWLAVRHEPGPPVVVLTFDDGYKDVIDHVAPITGRFGVYPIAGHLAESDRPCWVDEYYDILHTARIRSGFSKGPLQDAPSIDENLHWWVCGAMKKRLQETERVLRTEFLSKMRRDLDADQPVACGELYCSKHELRALLSMGADVGGHGLHHLRLSEPPPEARNREISAAWRLLDELGVTGPRTFCYPDGAWSSAAAGAVTARGFGAAFTVDPGVAGTTARSSAFPRFIVRDRPPTDPAWCVAFAEATHP